MIDVLRELSDVLNNVARELRSKSSELELLAKRLVDEGSAIAIESGSADWRNVASVDGSRARIATIGSISIYLCKAAALRMDGRVVERVKVFSVDASLDEDAEGCAEDAMIYLETSLYEHCSSSRALLIDGPIVDPPREQRSCSTAIARDLHGYRARVVKQLIDSGSTVLGVVKRLRGSVLGVPAPIAYAKLCEAVERLLGRNEARLIAVPYLNPIAPPDLTSRYVGAGISIASIVVLDKRRYSVYRVDVAPSSSINTALKLLSSIPPSNDGIPLPVALAHEASKIPRRLVETLRARVKGFLLAYAFRRAGDESPTNAELSDEENGGSTEYTPINQF